MSVLCQCSDFVGCKGGGIDFAKLISAVKWTAYIQGFAETAWGSDKKDTG